MPKRDTEGFLYLLSNGEFIKIGWAIDVARRIAQLQTGNARKLELIATKIAPLSHENIVQRKLWKHHARSEWFKISALAQAKKLFR